MSELTSAFPNHKFEINGVQYKVKLVSYSVMAEFENNLFSKTLAHLKEVQHVMTPEHYERKLDECLKAFDDGEFGFQGTRGKKALEGMPGMVMLASLLLSCPEDEAVKIATEHTTELVNLIKMVHKESFPASGKGSKKKEVATKDS